MTFLLHVRVVHVSGIMLDLVIGTCIFQERSLHVRDSVILLLQLQMENSVLMLCSPWTILQV